MFITAEEAYLQGTKVRDGVCPYVDFELAEAWKQGRAEQTEIAVLDRTFSWRPILFFRVKK